MNNNWQIKKLSDFLSIQNGYAFDSKNFSELSGTPLIRIRDLKDGINTKIKYNGEYEEKYIVRYGDFLIGMDGEFNCYEWKGGNALLNQRVCRLQNFKDIHSRFLFYGINKYLKEIEDVTTFVTVKHISSKQIEDIQIPFPSIDEQKRIVGVLDEVFAEVDKAKENTEKNLKNTRELFESYLQSVFANHGKDWNAVKLGDFLKLEYGKPLDKKDRIESGKFPVYGANGVKDRTNKFYYDKPTIIIGRKGSAGELTLTKSSFWPLDVTYFVTFEDRVYDLKFVYFLLSSLGLTKLAKGVKPGINRNDVYSINVVIPRLVEQKSIVKKLDELSAQTKKLEEIYKQKLANLEELKKSVLKSAFAGEL